jgi:aryl-alcohol dehydrogenase-like predicted oxidoreductase
MRQVPYGRAGFLSSNVILGTMNFGPHTSEADAFSIMDRAIDGGINHFDTANQYGGDGHWGRTETILGNYFTERKNRDKVVLATKVSADMGDQIGQNGVHAINIKRSCEASLRRLKTDHIDLYIMHHIDWRVRPEEWMQAMEQLVREGKVVYVGSSNFPGWTLAQAMERQQSRSFLGLVSEQHLYNMTNRAAELEVIPACRAYDIAFTVYSPLASGLLAGKLKEQSTGRRALRWSGNADAQLLERVARYEALCADFGLDPAIVGQAWVLNQPGVTGLISGPRIMSQLEASLTAADCELSPDQLLALGSIFPTMQGRAPEAYAW